MLELQQLQPLNINWTYFDVLGYSSPQPVIDISELTDRMRQCQKILHPDKFSGKSSYEVALASDASSFINKAYDVLQKPVKRYEYILDLHGMSTDNPEFQKLDNSVFLSEVMDIIEEVRDVIDRITNLSRSGNIVELTNDLSRLVCDLHQRLDDQEKIVIDFIKNSDWSNALVYFSQYKYILKVLEELREHELTWKKLGIDVSTT
uniref:J domain-containing protein n=1 Tax=Trichobilharzia regenti TaxID=157069 RepID=A0AA85JKS6_TRIRE|nr:unnamed protein product [Trichobilharzia regenti]